MLLLPCSAIKHWFIFAYKPLKLTRFICKLHFQMWFYAIKLVLVCQQWFHLRMYIVVLVHIKKNKKSFRKKGKSCRQIFDGLISHPAHLSKHKSCQVAFVMAKKKKKKKLQLHRILHNVFQPLVYDHPNRSVASDVPYSDIQER